jgi:hypothetical protein
MGNTKRKQRQTKRKIRRTRHKNIKGGGCPCNKGFQPSLMLKGGFGKASFQPFEQIAGQYYSSLNNYNSDPNMPNIMGSGRLSAPLLRGGKRKSIRNKKMRGGELLLGNNKQILPLSFGTTGGSMAAVNVLTGSSNYNQNAYSQPVGVKQLMV